MRYFLVRAIGRAAVLVLALAVLAACEDLATEIPGGSSADEDEEETGEVAFDSTGTTVTFVFPEYPEDTMRVLVRSTQAIDRAKAYMLDPDSFYDHLLGKRILRGSGIDPNYPWHWDPARIGFAEGAVGCIGGIPPMRTEEEVDAWIEHAGPTYCVGAEPIAIEEPNDE